MFRMRHTHTIFQRRSPTVHRKPSAEEMLISCVAFLTFIVLINANLDVLRIDTKSGPIKGTRYNFKIDGKNHHCRVFYGIPYAEPPIKHLRFQPPVPVNPWIKTLNADTPPPKCVQPTKFNENNSPIEGQEDCLYLNIYVPNVMVQASRKSPVIVYIHGGGFQCGQAIDYKPDYFMDKNVIFVMMNYRLGVLGFLGMNNDHISGNFGMKDQSMALKWIKDNIAQFGGDPDNITLMGVSAGSAAVHLHMFSPLSKGLFHKVIMHSGSAYATWTYYDEAYTQPMAFTLIQTTGCYYKDPATVLKCLQRVPAEELIKTENKLYVWDFDPTIIFKITIESDVKNQPFLTQKPSKETYVTKNIPWITGMNSGEGIFKVIKYLSNDASLAKIINNDKMRLLPLINQYLYTARYEHLDEITQKIDDYYFGKNGIGIQTGVKFVDMVTDSLFTYPMIKSLQTRDDRRYVYLYDNKGSYSSRNIVPPNIDLGVSHTDDLPMIFRNVPAENRFTLQDKQVSKSMVKFWYNFATYTDPNGHFKEKVWKPVESNNIEFLHIKNDSISMEKNLLKQRYEFWESQPLGRKNV